MERNVNKNNLNKGICTLDLNIDNYSVEDILKLFNLLHDFTYDELKKAKQIVLKTHPDKSKLNPDIFRFYVKAYKVLYLIYEFKRKSNTTELNETYENARDKISNTECFNNNYTNTQKENKSVIETFIDKKKKENKQFDFNKWFNNEFEKNKLQREDDENGYGQWLKSDEDIEEIKQINKADMNRLIEDKKRHLKSMVVYKGINDINYNNVGYDIMGENATGSYSSDIFSNLQYEDLRKAHTETVIPITEEDYLNVRKFKNVNEYNNYRQSQDLNPLSKEKAQQIFENKAQHEEIIMTENAYKLAKQTEDSLKRQQNTWKQLFQIEYYGHNNGHSH